MVVFLFDANLLFLISEEVFEASEETQAEWKTRKLKEQMISEFGPVMELCRQVLINRVTEGLIKTTLESLSHFLKWIPATTVLNTDLIVLICNQVSRSMYNILDQSSVKHNYLCYYYYYYI